MKYLPALLSCGIWIGAYSAYGAGFLTPDDFILAIDTDLAQSDSGYPGGELPSLLLDGTPDSKYLNFGGRGTGFIVTPGPSVAQSFQLWTANDADWRDPTSYQIYGTNQPISSTDNSDGLGETWNLIAEGGLDLPFDRFAAGGVVSFTNAQSYSSYKMVFPTMRWPDDAIQLGEAQIYGTSTGTSPLLNSGTPVLGIHNREFNSAYFSPDNNPWGIDERPELILDGNPSTKLLNFGWKNTGFVVTPAAGSTNISGFRVTTANDADGRDPTSWELWGTNSSITSEDNSRGDSENWTLIQSSSIELPFARGKLSDVVPVTNNAGSFTSYKLVFPTTRTTDGGLNGNMAQIADIEFFEGALPTNDPITLRVNRQTGMMSIVSTVNYTIDSYEIASTIIGGINHAEWDSITAGNRDPDDQWIENVSQAWFLREMDLPGQGADNGIALTAGVPFELGNLWLRTPFEDLTFTVRNAQGAIIADGVEFVGTGVNIPGDYNADGMVNIGDWPYFNSVLGSTDLGGLSIAEAYMLGDLDMDGDSDVDDYNFFVNVAGGRAALFGTTTAVPEPSTIALVILAAVGLLVVRRRGGATSVLGLVGLCVLTGSVRAQSFTNLGSPVSATTNAPLAGGSSAMDLFDDFDLDDPTIFQESLSIYNYNENIFNQFASTTQSPTVFLDFGSTLSPNWFGYAQRLDEESNYSSDRVGKFEFWFSNTDFNELVPATAPNTTFVYAPGDNRIRSSVINPFPLYGEFTGRYVAVRFTMAGGSEGENEIGGHEFRFLEGPADVVLQIDRSTGDMLLRNDGSANDTALAQTVEIRGYQISSPSGALDPTDFTGLGGNSGFPLGNGTGSGWEVAGGSNANRLLDTYFGGSLVSSSLAAGTTGIALGDGYDEYSLTEDVVFRWTDQNGRVYDGRVAYVGSAPEGLPGDYNGDGTVNLADYTVWRDTLGATGTGLAADGNGDNSVNAEDYGVWKSHFGESISGASAVGTTAVPEPASIVLTLLGLLGLARLNRNRFALAA